MLQFGVHTRQLLRPRQSWLRPLTRYFSMTTKLGELWLTIEIGK
jgi:hypothetical protein